MSREATIFVLNDLHTLDVSCILHVDPKREERAAKSSAKPVASRFDSIYTIRQKSQNKLGWMFHGQACAGHHALRTISTQVRPHDRAE